VLGQDLNPAPPVGPQPQDAAPSSAVLAGYTATGKTPGTQAKLKWDARNTAYNQILLNLLPDVQSLIDSTNLSSKAWEILTFVYESKDPSHIAVLRSHYNNHHMVDGQTIHQYLSALCEMHTQLKGMGDNISDITHSGTIICNLPDSWSNITAMVQFVAKTPDEVERQLEAHEALTLAHCAQNQLHSAYTTQTHSISGDSLRCKNCSGRHDISDCWRKGGGAEGQALEWWKMREKEIKASSSTMANLSTTIPTRHIALSTIISNPIQDIPSLYTSHGFGGAIHIHGQCQLSF